jgi:hypothetical protein
VVSTVVLTGGYVNERAKLPAIHTHHTLNVENTWADQGFLKLSPGHVIDYRDVKAHLEWGARVFELKESERQRKYTVAERCDFLLRGPHLRPRPGQWSMRVMIYQHLSLSTDGECG